MNKSISISLSQDLLRVLQKEAKESRRAISSIASEAIEKLLKIEHFTSSSLTVVETEPEPDLRMPQNWGETPSHIYHKEL